MSGSFDYVKYDHDSQEKQSDFKFRFEQLEEQVKRHPKGRAQALALTKLEEAYMWVGKMIRDEQIQRNGNTELQESRG